jgi:predicted transcriptional regulator
MSGQTALTQYEKRTANFAKHRALILKIIHAQPGLTTEEISKEFMLRYGFLPTIDNRLRELRAVGYVESRQEGLLRWYPKHMEA